MTFKTNLSIIDIHMVRLFSMKENRIIFVNILTLDFISNITLSIASFFKKRPILMGYDSRESSVIISKIVSAALRSAGLDSAVCSLVPTPCLQFATKKLGYNGGIMVTASHNPPEYNGIKVVAKDGIEISREDERKVEEFYFKKEWKTSKRYGLVTNEIRATGEYLRGIKAQVNTSKIRSQRLKVVLDLGNGAQAVTDPLLCRELGCEFIVINEKIDSSFPGRGYEPKPQKLTNQSSSVANSNA